MSVADFVSNPTYMHEPGWFIYAAMRIDFFIYTSRGRGYKWVKAGQLLARIVLILSPLVRTGRKQHVVKYTVMI